MTLPRSCIIWLSFISLLATDVVAIWPFPSKRFTGSSLLEAGPLGITQEGRVVAFGDFNGDQLYVHVNTLGFTLHTYNILASIS